MKKIIKFIIDDIKSDIVFIKDFCNGEYKGKLKKVNNFELMKKGDFWLSVLKEYWLFFILCIGFFLAGIFIGSIMAYNDYERQLITEILPNCYLYQN
jgi:hypothetical protein